MKSRRLTPSKTLIVASATLSSGRAAVFVQSFSPPHLLFHYSNKLRLMTPTTITSTHRAVRRRRSSSALSTTTTTFNNNYDDSGSSSYDVDDQHHYHRFFILRHGETDANASGQIQGSSDISRLTDLGRKQAIQAAVSGFNHLPMIHQVYVSPLTRAQETLSILRQHTAGTGRRCCLLPDVEEKIVTMEELREIDLYEWEGRDKTDLEVNDPIAYKAWTTGDSYGFEVSGRKPLLETWDRANEIWNKIRSSQSKSQQQTTTTTTTTMTTSEDQQHYRRKTATTNNNTANTTTTLNNNTLLVCHGTLGQALLCTAFRWDPTHFRKHEFPNCGIVEILWRPEQNAATGFRWHHPEKPSDDLVLYPDEN